MPALPLSSSAALAITNLLVLYRALLATRQIDPDPAQHRLAIHLQKLYFRLKDYSPQPEYRSRLNEFSQAVEEEEYDASTAAVPGHPLRRNPLFAHLFARKERKDVFSLIKIPANDEAAINLDSPRGLVLYGEVGTGKSILLNILADSLPNRKKKRWHLNTFMLETLSCLETFRQSRSSFGNSNAEYSLLWLAKDMIEKSPILFLDEFQLPDRATSKVLSNLLTLFFRLGGILIASSNRMPEELANASGFEYAPPPRGGLVRNWLGLGSNNRTRGGIFAGSDESTGFLEVLRARCEIWDIGSGKDWRRREIEEIGRDEMIEAISSLEKTMIGNTRLNYEHSISDKGDSTGILKNMQDMKRKSKFKNTITPKKYLLQSVDSENNWTAVIRAPLPADTPAQIPWEPTTLLVYGRKIPVPLQYAGVALWLFDELCGDTFGPADYITIASSFHTLIVDKVPILTLIQKNEAKWLITLLDALYEASCKLIIRAEAGPDELFFPETQQPASIERLGTDTENETDATYPETFSEIYQDQTSPFRPNVSLYIDEPKTGCNPYDRSQFEPASSHENVTEHRVNFSMTSSFIGKDERFAYKRARSRLWEMCGSRWHARSEPHWWKPVPLEIRRWER